MTTSSKYSSTRTPGWPTPTLPNFRREEPGRVGAHSRSDFSLRDARQLVNDLFEPRPWIYWVDFSLSIGLGTAALLVLRRAPLNWAGWGIIYAAAVLAFYRAAMFSHEVVHLRAEKFKAFRIYWNLLCGIPFLIPSFLYQTHTLHHVRKHYGTANDGEYLPLATGPVRNIFLFLCEPLVMPAIAVVRFLVLAPLTWISPRSRKWVYAHASSMVIDPTFVRPLPGRGELRTWRLQEAACFALALGTLLAVVSGLRPWQFVRDLYLIAAGVLMINAIRTMGAHRYLHRGEPVSFVEQLVDSLNYPNHPITGELWAPVGLRYHALHHLFPSLPYHALPAAHERLMAGLPSGSPYHLTICSSLPSALLALWRRARSSTTA
ncbi:MAG TPA: fatty acid desaturase [Pirellulales bacterium]